MSDNFEDLREREVLDIASKTNVISDGVKKVLVIGLDRRNLAAHPSGIHIAQQKLAALSESNVEERVATFIAGQLAALRLEVLELNAGAIGWDALIEDAARRRGVFKGSDNREKGFRDRLIAETFMQHPNTE